MAEVIDDPNLRNRVRVFDDRLHAGELLAERLDEYKGAKDTYILAIPAGGVQVALSVEKRLKIPMDLAITRKIHVPWNKEAGFGAISWDGDVFLNDPLVAALGISREQIERCVAVEKEVIRRRLKSFRGERPFPDLKNKTAIIIDDGLASGFSMLTTVKTLKRIGLNGIVVAVPTAPSSAVELLRPWADRIFCLNIRSGYFFAVADAYEDWYDLKEEDVVDILKRRNNFR